jgi:uncharacterized LabA/DUF88 family protein
MEKDLKLAVLIDGDNIPARYIKEMMEEMSKYGNPTIKRIYGDWTKPHLSKWKKVLLENAITPIQQYSYTVGKNATDSAMIIDAMDILYSDKVNGFCLVSSDSDFTRLATRLREAGMTVFGLGEKKTPNPFIVACDRFIYIEILKKQKAAAKKADAKEEDEDNQLEKVTPKVIELIQATIEDLADDDGWAFLGEVGSLLQKKQPNFDSRNYGFQKLTPMINAIGQFEIEQRDTQRGRFKLIYVRNAKQEKPAIPQRKSKGKKKATKAKKEQDTPEKVVEKPARRDQPMREQPQRKASKTKEKKTTKDNKAYIKFEREELILLQDHTDQMTKMYGLDARISSLTGKRKVGFLKRELESLDGILMRLKGFERYEKSQKLIEQLLRKIRGGIKYIEGQN